MKITKTPFRMSFFGGGTDMEWYFKEFGGAVISTTIDKYCYVTVRDLPKFFDYRIEISYSQIERVLNREEINHPLVKNAMKYYDIDNIRLTYEADLPARSGLGTSSSFAVGMLNAFSLLSGDKYSKRRLADDAIFVERVLCNESGGWQDQIAASFGGFNRIDFSKDGYKVKPLNISKSRLNELNNNLLMFFTGFTRFSSEIQKENFMDKNSKIENLKKIYSLVDRAEEILLSEEISLDEFGELLHETWIMKRNTGNSVSNAKIDELYDTGIKSGAIGGKLLGAGGGGFLVFYVNPKNQENVKKALSDLLYIPFKFESKGTHEIKIDY